VTDEFMQAVVNKGTYFTRYVQTGEPCEELDASEILRMISEGTYICGDPGLQFDTTINNWHTCPNSGRINSSNPCSEYMHLDNSACNLASINLLKYLDESGQFDVEGFRHTVDVLIRAQDMLVDNSSYPFEKIGETARAFRQLGLGYANLGALLMSLGLPYDSDDGRKWAASITALMTGQAYLTSAELAERIGPFAGYKVNAEPMLRVISMHREKALELKPNGAPEYLVEAAQNVWDLALEKGRKFGYRNSQATVLAPTGTISFMMDCDTTGIEPDISLIKYKQLSDGGLIKIVNRSVERALRNLGYSEGEISSILEWIDEHDTIEGAPALKEEHLPIFDCALKPAGGKRSIHYMGHLKMMAAAQPFISGAISKTVNLPQDITVEEIFDTYVKAWEMGLKAVALYRDGSKRTQPLSAGSSVSSGKGKGDVATVPARRRLPDERRSITHKMNVGGLEGYLTVGLYDDGKPGEIFLVVAKEGSTLSGIMDAFATAVSIALQYGVPLSALVKKFSHMRFEPSGFTQNPQIPMAKSIIDYVFRWLGAKFLTPEECKELGLIKPVTDKAAEESKSNLEENPQKEPGESLKVSGNATSGGTSASNGTNHVNGAANGGASGDANFIQDPKSLIMSTFQNSLDAPPCTNCGSSMMVRQAGCYVCLNCGAQGGCG
ncbi:MAG: vitamin B12-dependent ribonucleotide reductase, partial [Candidatus Dadabacteria bacterium]